MLRGGAYAMLRIGSETWSTPAVGRVQAGYPTIIVTATRLGDVVAFEGNAFVEIWRRNLGATITASPTIVDVNDDGANEVVIGTEHGMLYVLRLSDGGVLWQVLCGKAIRATAAVSDVDGDGRSEVLVGVYGPWMLCLDGANGAIKWRTYLPKHEFYRGTKIGIVSSPLIADVNLDGEQEIVTGGRSRRVYCLSGKTGKIIWFREFKYDPDSTASFAVVNKRPTVFIGGGEHTAGGGDKAILALKGNDGSLVWETKVNGGVDSSPTVADIDGDGRLEVIACSLADSSCYACDAITGHIKWRYKFGPTETCVHDANNVCRLKTANGVYLTEDAICRSYTSPLVADVDADGAYEIVVGSNNGQVVILDGKTGKVKGSEYTGGMVRGSPILEDIDGDGFLELVIASGEQLMIYRTYAQSGSWSMFKGNAQHLGWINPEVKTEIDLSLPGQRFMHLRLIWYWLVVDSFRYVVFKLERWVLRRFNIKLFDYYY